MQHLSTILLKRWAVKTLDLAHFIVGIIPIILLIGVSSYAVRARYFLGYWPRPNFPDPKHLPFDLHYNLVAEILYLTLWTLVLMPILFFIMRRIPESKIRKISGKVFMIGWVVILIMIFVPTINFVTWFVD